MKILDVKDLWTQNVQKMISDIISANRCTYKNKDAVVNAVCRILRNDYGIAIEQLKKDFYYIYDRKPSKLECIVSNHTIKDIFLSILTDLHNECTAKSCRIKPEITGSLAFKFNNYYVVLNTKDKKQKWIATHISFKEPKDRERAEYVKENILLQYNLPYFLGLKKLLPHDGYNMSDIECAEAIQKIFDNSFLDWDNLTSRFMNKYKLKRPPMRMEIYLNSRYVQNKITKLLKNN